MDEAWRPAAEPLTDEERSRLELEAALAELDRAQRQREMWGGLPADQLDRRWCASRLGA